MALTCFEIELDTFKCSPLIAIEACQPYFGEKHFKIIRVHDQILKSCKTLMIRNNFSIFCSMFIELLHVYVFINKLKMTSIIICFTQTTHAPLQSVSPGARHTFPMALRWKFFRNNGTFLPKDSRLNNLALNLLHATCHNAIILYLNTKFLPILFMVTQFSWNLLVPLIHEIHVTSSTN